MIDGRMTVGFAMTVSALVLPLSALAAETVELKAKYKPGSKSYVVMTEDVKHVTMMPGGGQMEQKLSKTRGVIEEVKSSSKDGARIEMTYDRVASGMESPMMGNMNYDSDMPSDNESADFKRTFEPMLGMPMTMELDKDNNVKSFSGMDAIRKKIEASAGGNMVYAQMKGEFNDEHAKLVWGSNRLMLLPNRTVKTGETWDSKREESIPEIGGLIFKSNCKLDRITEVDGRESAIIVYDGTITQNPDIKPTEMSMGEIKIEKGTFKGTATFDIKDGRIVKDDQTSNINFKLTMLAAGGQAPPEITIKMENDSLTTVKSLAEREKEKKENKRKAETKKSEDDEEDEGDDWEDEDEDDEEDEEE